MQIDPHNIVLYRSVYTGDQVDSLLGLIQPAKTLAEGLDTRVKVIEDKLSPKVVLTIQQMDFTGGTSIQSPAGGEIIAVEDLPRGYKCYFDTNHGSEPVLFHVNDQAMGRRYDIGTTTDNYFWRLVTEVGEDYIVLSKTDCDPTSGAPAVGDKVITVGNRYDVQRQNVKISTTIGENRDEWYAGISSYNLDNKLVTVVGVKDGKVGIWTENGYFSGEIHITGGQGLDNLEEWEEVARQISDAWAKAVKAETDAANAQYTADAAALQAERIELQLKRINSDTVLDITEKKVIRTEWITINGREDLDRTGNKGSYFKTRNLYDQYASLGGRVLFSYNGVEYTFNGAEYTYKSIGLSALDAAYLALREYLREVGLNDRTTDFEGFDRQRMADLLTAYYDAEKQVNDNITAAVKERIEQAKAEVLQELAGFQEAIEGQLEEMQDVIDNTIETWFMDGAPSLVSLPASDWNTDELKKRHLGDLYYDNLTGYAYRFQYGDNKYFWKYIEDSALAKALAAAARAQDTADGKRRTFLSQPTAADAYDPGDMWLHATVGDYTNETLVCITAKVSGVSFSAAHWSKASKYTDDTVANAAKSAAEAAQATADDAAAAAAAAQTAADNAATAAAAANTRLNGWASDGSISPVEKEALRQQKADIIQEYGEYINQATIYGVSTSAYMAAYTAAIAALNKYTAASPENITIDSDYDDIAAYFTARTTIAQAIATAAKKVATDAQASADAAQATADQAVGLANAAQAAADAAQAAANAAKAAADAAQTAADNAATAAAAANTRLNGWASDGSISPVEKEALRQQKADIIQEYGEYINQATIYGVSTTAYIAAYDAAIAALNKYTATTPENITIGSDYADIAGYFSARTTIAQAIAAAAKKVATDAQAAADAAQARADQAVGLANAAQVAANAAQAAANAAQAAADAAQAAADAAQEAADNAQDDADAANTRLNGWASDTVISPVEKEALRQQKKDIQGEYQDVINQATRYNVSSTAYTTAYNAAVAALDKYTATTPENITIAVDYDNIGLYYNARSTIMQAVAAAAKAEAEAAQAAADAAQAAADAAQAAADDAQGTADSALSAARTAQTAAGNAAAAAAAAQSTADAAATAAAAANTRLNGWASDGSISPLEKTSLSQQKDEITAEYAGIRQQALAYNLDTQAYDDAYDDALAALTKYTAASPENITIGPDYADIAAYYAARTTITTAIAAAAKAAAAEAKSIADSAMTEAVRLKEALEHINRDTVLDIAEKKSLRTEWITINGLEDLDRSGGRGSYYQTKRLLEQYSNLGKQTTFVYNGVEYSFGGVEYTFALSGTSALDAAYLALREYLREVGLNDRTTVFEGFDRKHLADLLTAYYDAERLVNDSITQAVKDGMEAVREEILAELAGFQETMEQQLEEMQDVIDNTIETHFAGGTPTLSNYPANQWTTEELKQRHLGDLYYDNASKESSATSGFAFRFERSGSAGSYTYFWHQLSDNAIAEALAKAAKAQDTADGKRRTFLSQPTTADAYDRGDMWLHATIGDYTNETLVCLTSKAAGTAFQASHWGLASKYTDDTVANLARQEAAAAQTTANNAAQAASAAQTAADNAATEAAAANTRLNGWASNGSISPVEKEALRQQKHDIVAERADIVAQATAYNVSTTAYMAAYNAALAALDKYTATTPENITIESDYADIANYFSARTTIAQAIAAAAKKVATDAQAAADAAQATADQAVGLANAAQEAADAAQDAADAAQATADDAATAAAAAQTAADNAATAAAAANTRLNGWASDGSISPVEKEALRQQKKDIQGEYQDVINQATRYNVSSTAYTTAYNAAVAALDKYTATTPENIDIAADYGNIGLYYNARSTVMQAVAAAAKAEAEAAQAAADAAQDAADAAQAAADAAQAAADAAQTAAETAQATADSAAAAAAAAQSTADNAATAAAAANTRLNGWASDGSISPVEKEALRQQKKDIVAERADIVAQATAYNVSSTAYMAAYNAAVTALDKYTAITPENITIESDYANIEAYYTARSAILQAIAAAAKQVADDAQSAADAAQHAAEVADGKAEAAAAAAAAVAAAVANINDDTILDPSEKGEIRTTWISINGVLDTDKHGQTGTYAAAKEAIDKAAGASLPVQFTYAGIIYTFAGVEYTFQNLGAASLDAAYLALREYLSGLQINTTESFLGFSRSEYSQLLRDYNVALNNVLKALSDIATEKADDALSSIELINAALEKMGSDNYISAQEKLTLKTALQDESVVYNTLQTQAARYSTTAVQTAFSAYNTAYTHFGNVVTYYCEKFPWANDVAISADYPLSRISAYYTAREALVDAIHAAEKDVIDSKANTADFKYLKDALPADQTTDIDNAMVLSSFLGVKDAGNVVAGLSGLVPSGFAEFPMLWAAAQSILLANTAKWRVYRDGRQILGVHNGKRIEILPDSEAEDPDPRIEIYDKTDNASPSSVFSGRTYNSIADVFGSAGSSSLSANTATISGNNINVEDPTYHSSLISVGGDTYYHQEQYAAFTTQKAGKVSFSGTINLSGNFNSDNLCALRFCQISVLLDGVSIGGFEIADDSVDTNWSGSASYAIGARYLAAGTHYLTIRIKFEIPASAGPLIGYSASVTHSSTAISIEYDAKRNELFGNGLAIGQSNLNYLWAANEGNKFRFKVVCGNAGMEIYNGICKIKLGGQWYSLGVSGSSIVLTSTSE